MRVLVAVPAYNEAQTVADVVREVGEHRPGDTVLVVDDGSRDDTAIRAQDAGAAVLRLPFNTGVGAAMRTAFTYAQRRGYDAVVQVDADGQHDPASIQSVLDGLESAAVVVGARGDSIAVRGPRRWAMIMLARSLTAVTGTHLTDVTSGFRAADRRAIALYARSYPSEYLGDTVESLMLAHREGLKIAEVPVVMRPRQGGRPTQGTLMSAAYLSRALLALVVSVTRKQDLA